MLPDMCTAPYAHTHTQASQYACFVYSTSTFVRVLLDEAGSRESGEVWPRRAVRDRVTPRRIVHEGLLADPGASGVAPSCGRRAQRDRRYDSGRAICRRCARRSRLPWRHRGPANRDPDTLAEKVSTMDGHACILVDVHPGLLGKLSYVANHSFNPKLRMNNLHSNDN